MKRCIRCRALILFGGIAGSDGFYCGADCASKAEREQNIDGTDQAEFVLNGNQGKTLFVFRDSIRIEKQGVVTGSRQKVIPIRNITSVEVKSPGMWAGFIQFSIAGGIARDSSFTLTGGAFDAAGDENSVLFQDAESHQCALRVKSFIESWTPTNVQQMTNGRMTSPADEIRKLKELRDEGILSQTEFETQKKRLLGM